MESRVRSKAKWLDDDEDFRLGGGGGGGGGGRAGLRAKPRFTFSEVKMLLQSVMKNRYIVLGKFNQGVSAETKKRTWADITRQINALGENQREVRQIMKKWADLKCDGKRRIAALRGPNGLHIRKKTLGPVEKMVHKILMMTPQGDADSDLDFGDDDNVPKRLRKNVPTDASSFSYLSLTENLPTPQLAALDFSPMSSPEKDPSEASPDLDLADDGDYGMDFDDNDDSLFSSSVPPSSSTSLDPLPDDALLRVRPVHTYSRSGQTQTQTQTQTQNQNSSKPIEAASSAPSAPPAAAPPSSQSPPPVSEAAAAASSSSSFPPRETAGPAPSPSPSSHPQPPPAPCSSSTSSPSSSPSPADGPPVAAAAAAQRAAQMASQSLQQQRAGRLLLASVSRSLELLAQSVQLLVESQQEFVQESLLLQRETVDILRDFSGTALAMLRDKGGAGPLAARHHHH